MSLVPQTVVGAIRVLRAAPAPPLAFVAVPPPPQQAPPSAKAAARAVAKEKAAPKAAQAKNSGADPQPPPEGCSHGGMLVAKCQAHGVVHHEVQGTEHRHDRRATKPHCKVAAV